jgi:hypothetical protein
MSLKCPGTGNHELNGPGNYSSHQFFVRVRPGNHFTSFLWAWELGSQGFPLTLTTALLSQLQLADLGVNNVFKMKR